MELSGGTQTAITSTGQGSVMVSAPTDMSFVVYVSDKSGNDEVYKANLDGSSEANLSGNAATDTDAVVSADGSKIVFLSTRSGARRIWTMNANGSGATMLTTRTDILNVSVSPDGSKVAFSALVAGFPQIFVINVNGTSETNISGDATADHDFPAFNPTGTKIVFVGDLQDVYQVNVDGSSKQKLFGFGNDIQGLSFTPSGSQLVFMGDNSGAWDIYKCSTNGTGVVNLTNTGTDEFKNSGYIGP